MSKPKKSVSKLKIRNKFNGPLLGLIMVFVVGAGYGLVHLAFAASGVMSITPATTNASVGSTVVVAIHVNGGSDALNAVEADLTYPTSQLQYVSADSSTGSFPLEAQAHSGGSGTVSFFNSISAPPSGSSPANVTGDALIANVTFKAIGAGTATIGIASSSQALSAANSSNVLTTRNSGTITISDTTPPTAPTAITKTASTLNSITFGWTAATDNVAVTGYNVFRNGNKVGTVSLAGTSYTDNGLAPGSNYTYTVSAFDAAGNTSPVSASAALSTLPDTTAPSVPTSVTKSANSLTSITVTWAPSTDNVAVAGYKVLRNSSIVNTTTTTSYTDTSLTPGTSYNYGIEAVDGAGNVSAPSATTPLSTLADTTAPSIPSGLAANTQTGNSVTLSWSASTDNVGTTGYKIYRNSTLLGTSATTSYTAAIPTTPGISTFTVAAYDAAGNVSSPSSGLNITTYGAADVNHDGKVNLTDLSLLLANWGRTGNGDINGDGTVNLIDLSMLLTAWTG